MKKIRKRDGSVVFFQSDKIEGAIWKAVRAVGGKDEEKAKELAGKVVGKLEKIHGAHGIVDVEDAQDLIEKVLIEEGHAKVAKAFILYRKSRSELRDVKGLFDTIEAVEDYIGLNDWMVKENSNMGYSLQGLNNYIATKIVANYWMRRIYPEAVRKVHESGDLHVHDLGTLGAYCVGWDLKDLLTVGFKGVKGKVESRPAKHLRTALGQMVNFFYTLQGESAGAQAFSNFDTLLAPFIRYDGLTYKEVKQAMQEFVFNLAVPTRVGFQTPFTNITMDLKVPKYMENEHVVVGGEVQMDKYGDFQMEMDMINKAFAECMLEGDASGQVFTFPIPTYNITKDFDFDKPENELIWEMTAKYGIPNFSNYINSDMNPEDARSMCCRLRIDNTELQKRGGGLFGANPQTGSIGVVTINMPRLGYVSVSEDDFMSRLDRLMELAKESLEIKRKAIEKFTEMGLYPYSRFYLRQVYDRFKKYWQNHFGTIGLLGMNEAIVNFMPGEDITTPKGHAFALKVLDFMRHRLIEYQEETGNLYNLEATPGEGTTYRFARMDKKRFGRIIVANEEAVRSEGAKPYYTNSTQLPVGFTDDVFEALDLQDELQCRYTGGTNFHTFVGERMTMEAAKIMVKKIANGYKIPYFTISPTFSICPIHGYLSGEHEYCPKCDLEIAEGRSEPSEDVVEEEKREERILESEDNDLTCDCSDLEDVSKEDLNSEMKSVFDSKVECANDLNLEAEKVARVIDGGVASSEKLEVRSVSDFVDGGYSEPCLENVVEESGSNVVESFDDVGNVDGLEKPKVEISKFVSAFEDADKIEREEADVAEHERPKFVSAFGESGKLQTAEKIVEPEIVVGEDSIEVVEPEGFSDDEGEDFVVASEVLYDPTANRESGLDSQELSNEESKMKSRGEFDG